MHKYGLHYFHRNHYLHLTELINRSYKKKECEELCRNRKKNKQNQKFLDLLFEQQGVEEDEVTELINQIYCVHTVKDLNMRLEIALSFWDIQIGGRQRIVQKKKEALDEERLKH